VVQGAYKRQSHKFWLFWFVFYRNKFNLKTRFLKVYQTQGWMADFGEYLPLKSYSNVNPDSWGNDNEEILHQVYF